MNDNTKDKDRIIPQKLLRATYVFAISTLLFALFFRFANLGSRIYDADESRKVLWLSGYSSEEFKATVYQGNILSAEQLKRYQFPNRERNLGDVFRVLSGKTEHVPLHHLITRFLMQIFGSLMSAKLVSALLSLASFPCFYWLCVELFKTPLAGWVGIAIFAISPFHTLSSQNAGSYSLWTVILLASSAALLKALRKNDRKNWLIYSLAFSLSFYTHLFSAIVAFGQGIYVLAIERFKLTKVFLNYCFASALGLLLFSPWIIVFFSNLGRVSEGTSYYDKFDVSFKELLQAIYTNSGKVFVDLYRYGGNIERLLHFAIALCLAYAFYLLVRKTPKNTWLFIVLLVTLSPLIHIIANFKNPSALHVQTRYYLASYLGLQLALTYLFTDRIYSLNLPSRQRRLWATCLVLLVSLGILSGSILMKEREAGLTDQRGTASAQNLAIAPYLNQAQAPLVITRGTHSFILALLYEINDRVRFQLLKSEKEGGTGDIDWAKSFQTYSDVFVLYPDGDLLKFIDNNKTLRREPLVKNLDKITLKSISPAPKSESQLGE